MPWLETAPMEQRERFVRDHQLALYTMAELSARYYQWVQSARGAAQAPAQQAGL